MMMRCRTISAQYVSPSSRPLLTYRHSEMVIVWRSDQLGSSESVLARAARYSARARRSCPFSSMAAGREALTGAGLID
jgi:hypothetical protein